MNWLNGLFCKPKREKELEEEVRSHLEMAARERMERGDRTEEAQRAARREFGNVELVKEVTQDVWGWRWLRDLADDARYGLRMLQKNPGFTSVAVLTLALGIGANTAIFSLMNAIMLRTLPVKNPSQLVLFGAGKWGGIMDEVPNRSWQLFSYPFYRQVQRDTSVFSDVTAISSMPNQVHGAIGEGTEVER